MMSVVDMLIFQVCEIDEPIASELHEESTPVRAGSPSTDGMAGTSSISAGVLSPNCHFCSPTAFDLPD